MSGKVLFSIVVPLYNKAPVVESTMHSILADTERVGEVLVIDDGSSDDGAAIVAAINDPRIRLISQANGGVSRARNAGIAAARCDWVAFLDADDLWEPDFLSTLESLALAYPDCGMLATSYAREDETGRRFPPAGSWTIGDGESRCVDDFYALMADGHLCWTGSIAVRRSLLVGQGMRFPEGESLGEDLDFFFQVAEQTSVALCNRPLAIYRESSQVSRLSDLRLPKLVPPFLERLDARWRAGALPEGKRPGAAQYLASHLEHVVILGTQAGRRREALPIIFHPLLRERYARWLGLLVFWALPVRIGNRILEWRRAQG